MEKGLFGEEFKCNRRAYLHRPYHKNILTTRATLKVNKNVGLIEVGPLYVILFY